MIDEKYLKKRDITTMERLIENNDLFIKSAINIISALGGTGKSTYIHHISKILKNKDMNVYYFDADSANTESEIEVYEPIKLTELEEALSKCNNNDVIIIDSLKSYCAYNQLDVMSNVDMMKLMLFFREMIIRHKMTVIFVHHSFKEKKLKNGEEHLFGSRAIEEQCDSAFLYKHNKCRIVKNRIGLIRDTEIDTPNKI